MLSGLVDRNWPRSQRRRDLKFRGLEAWVLGFVTALTLMASLAVPGALAAQPEVILVEPSFLRPVFGEVPVRVEIQGLEEMAGEAIEQVEIFVDDERTAILREAPYVTTVDVGQRNREHFFRALVTTSSGRTFEAQLRTPKLRVDEEVDLGLQQLYVTVTEGGSRVLDLAQEDFKIRDSGRAETIVTFEQGDIPMTAVLLMDVSQSMEGERMRAAVAGASAFLEGLQELDEAMLLLFSDEVVEATPFTHRPERLIERLSSVRTRGGTAINDHLYLALNYLDDEQGRRVVVLLSDGQDLLSVLPMEQVLWRARRSQALIYWIHLDSGGGEMRLGSSWRNGNENFEEFEQLRQAVVESGGRVELLSNIGQIEPTFAAILQELREQYALGYYPSNRRDDGSWHSVEVQVRRSSAQVRSREGYVD
ncbi:MAG: VWA domain-containing protein [Acidobacteriota bacterium]